MNTKKYYIHKTTLWLYETQDDHHTIEELIEAQEFYGIVDEILEEEGLKKEDELLILISANLGWNWEGEYHLTNPTKLQEEYIELSENAYNFFKEIRMERDCTEEIIELYVELKKDSVKQI